MKKTYFLDMEYASNPGHSYGLIISIGLISLDGKEELRQLIRPSKKINISRYCTELTGLSKEDLVDCPMLQDVYEDIFGSLGKDDVIYAWGDDGKVLKASAKSRAIDYNLNIIDYQDQIKKESKLFFSPGLKTTMNVLGLKDDYNHHDALDDAKMLRDIYMHLENNKNKKKKILKIRTFEYLRRLEQLNKEYSDVVKSDGMP